MSWNEFASAPVEYSWVLKNLDTNEYVVSVSRSYDVLWTADKAAALEFPTAKAAFEFRRNNLDYCAVMRRPAGWGAGPYELNTTFDVILPKFS